MSGFFRLARWVVLGFGLMWGTAWGQGATEDFSPKISPSALLRLDRLSTSGLSLQFAVLAKGEIPHQGGTLLVDAALWLAPAPGIAILEFYDRFKLDQLDFSIGKRARLVGPWREGVLGYDGLPGLYLGYPLEEGLGLEGALVVEDGLLRSYLGAHWGNFEFGLLLRPGLVPRVVYQADIFSIGLQTDRGLWGKIGLPLDLIQDLPLTLEGSLWWQPGVADNGNGGSVLVTQRLFLSLGARLENARFGFDIVRAPLEAFKLWFEYHFRQ
jgi:hypothetical protein